MKKLVIALALVLGCSSGAWAENIGRYQVVTVKLEEEKGKTKNIPVMIDTKTGRSWYLSAGQRVWYPMPIFAKKPGVLDQEMRELGAAYSAECINS